MAKANYRFDKRQRELKKAKEKAEKEQKKRLRGATPDGAQTEPPAEGESPA